MLRLAYAPVWIVASLLLVAAVIYGSVATFGSQIEIAGHVDKLEHALVYAFLAVWFTGLVDRGRYWQVAIALAALGLALEFTQQAMALGRVGDPWDMAANVLGIAVGLAVATRRSGGWAPKVEAWLSRN